MRPGTVSAAVCIVLVAVSTSLVLYLGVGLSIGAAGALSVAIFAALSLYGIQSAGSGASSSVAGQLHELARSNAELSMQIIELSRRIADLEGNPEPQAERPRTSTELPTTTAAELGMRLRPNFSPSDMPDPVSGPSVREKRATPEPPSPPFRDRGLPGLSQIPPRERPAPMPEPAPAPIRERPATPAAAASAPPAAPFRPRTPPVAPLAARAEQKPVHPTASTGPIGGPGGQNRIATVRAAIAADRIDLYLQPIVTLPQRDIRYYEALARLRTDDGTILEPNDVIPWAEPAGLMPMIDYAIVFRCVQVARRLQLKDRRIGLFCNLSGSTLYDRSAFQQLIELLAANSTLASLIVLEVTQGTLRTAGARELESLAALAARGFRFSLDHVIDLRLAPRDLADLGFRFVKVSAARLLDRTRADEGIPSTELSDALGLAGIELIAERIEEEATVTSLIDCDVRYGQGFLFSPPRQVLTEALQRIADRVERAAADGNGAAPEPGAAEAIADDDPAAPATARDHRDEKSPRLRPRI